MDFGFYEGINLSLSYCEECGYEQLDMDVCPECGSTFRDLNSGAGLSRPTAFRVQTLQPLGYISRYV